METLKEKLEFFLYKTKFGNKTLSITIEGWHLFLQALAQAPRSQSESSVVPVRVLLEAAHVEQKEARADVPRHRQPDVREVGKCDPPGAQVLAQTKLRLVLERQQAEHLVVLQLARLQVAVQHAQTEA